MKHTHFRSNDTMTSTTADGKDEETKARDQRKAKRKSTLASKKLEKDGLDPKSKKTRVLVEVEHDDADERQRAIL